MCDREEPKKYCEVCKRETDWEDGFNIETGEYEEFLCCAEHETLEGV